MAHITTCIRCERTYIKPYCEKCKKHLNVRSSLREFKDRSEELTRDMEVDLNAPLASN
jgi:hypothetical protein